jgi:hypothetical protein
MGKKGRGGASASAAAALPPRSPAPASATVSAGAPDSTSPQLHSRSKRNGTDGRPEPLKQTGRHIEDNQDEAGGQKKEVAKSLCLTQIRVRSLADCVAECDGLLEVGENVSVIRLTEFLFESLRALVWSFDLSAGRLSNQ